MFYCPKKQNAACVVIPVMLGVIGITAIGFSFYYPHLSYPVIYQVLAVICLVFAVQIASRYALSVPVYELTDPKEPEHPCGLLRVDFEQGRRKKRQCELELTTAVALIPKEQAAQWEREHQKPHTIFKYQRNLFAKDAYRLYAQAEETTIALDLEISDERFYLLLAQRISDSGKTPPVPPETEAPDLTA